MLMTTKTSLKRIKVCPVCFDLDKDCRCIHKCKEKFTVCFHCGQVIEVDNISKHFKTKKCQIDYERLKNGIVVIANLNKSNDNVGSLIKSYIKLTKSQKIITMWCSFEQKYKIDENGKRIKIESIELPIESCLKKIQNTDFLHSPNVSIYLLSEKNVSNLSGLTIFKNPSLNEKYFITVVGKDDFLQTFTNQQIKKIRFHSIFQDLNTCLNIEDKDSNLKEFKKQDSISISTIQIEPTVRSILCSNCYIMRGVKSPPKFNCMPTEKIHKCSEHPKSKRNSICNFCGKTMLFKEIKNHERNDCKFRMTTLTYDQDYKFFGSVVIVGSLKSMKNVSSVFVNWIKFKYPSLFISFVVEKDWVSLYQKIKLLSWNNLSEECKSHGMFLFVDQPNQSMIYEINIKMTLINFVQFIWINTEDKKEIDYFQSLKFYGNNNILGMCITKTTDIWKICNFENWKNYDLCFKNATITTVSKNPEDYFKYKQTKSQLKRAEKLRMKYEKKRALEDYYDSCQREINSMIQKRKKNES